MTSNFEARFLQHVNGQTHTTKRLGGDLQIIARRSYPTREMAATVERQLKAWKNPAKAIGFLDAE